MKHVELWLKETSDPIMFNARSTYTKGPLYCVRTSDDKVHKFPVANIFRTVEDYSQAEAENKKTT